MIHRRRSSSNAASRIVIIGAAGRDFHNFNVCFRNNPDCQVIAFTATQIPNIAGRQYPSDLAGPLYPQGIPILPESELIDLIRHEHIDQVIFAYSDVSHEHVMHEASRPGETTLRMADIVLINKMATAPPEGIDTVRRNAQAINPDAVMVEAVSPISVNEPASIRGASVLVVEDGPTLTHGGMKYGAGTYAAKRYAAREIIDPRPYACGAIAEVYESYPDIGPVLPAMGYGKQQICDLQRTIEAVPAERVIIATPIDLSRLIQLDKPVHRVRYELQVIGEPTLRELLHARFGPADR